MARTWLLALLFLGPSMMSGHTAEAQDSAWNLTDGINDLAIHQAGQTVPLPASGPYAGLDLQRVEIVEPDEESVIVRLKTQGPPSKPAPGAIGGSSPQLLAVGFRLPGTPTYAIVQVNLLFNPTSPTNPFSISLAELCASPRPFEKCQHTIMNPKVLLASDTIEVQVRKRFLLQELESQGTNPLPTFLAAGDRFTGIVAWSRASLDHSAEAAGEVRDRAPDVGEAPDFTLAHPSPTSDLTLHTDRAVIVAGEMNRIRLQLRNTAATDRLVNISASVVGDAPATGWTFAVTRNVHVRAGSTFNTSVRVQPPPVAGGEERDVLLRLRADIVGQGGAFGMQYVTLIAQRPLDEDNRRLWLHGWGGGGSLGVSTGYWNRLERDPKANDATGIALVPDGPISRLQFSSQRTFPFVNWIPNPARLLDDPTKGLIVIDSTLPQMDARLRLAMAAGPNHEAVTDVPITLNTGRNSYPVEFRFLSTTRALLPGHHAHLTIHVYSNATAHGLLAVSQWARPLRVMTPNSYLDLPVEAIPQEISADLAVLQLEAIGDPYAMANPGDDASFEFVARNEDEEPVAVRLSVANKTLPWNLTLVPGGDLRLGKFESARLAVVAQVPSNATEGSELVFDLVAAEATTGRDLARLTLRIVATRGVEIENKTFAPDPADAHKFAAQPPGTDFPGATAVLAVVSTALLLARRRSSGQ